MNNPVRCLDGPGTPESTWERSAQLRQAPSWTPPPPSSGRVVIVAPHPDDEILGAGGTLAHYTAIGADVTVVAVTDGEKSRPGQEDSLRRIRPAESVAAAERLGIHPAAICRLGHGDGCIDETVLARQLADQLSAGDVVLSPWEHDGHPDHDRVGRATLVAGRARRATIVSYFVWAWHWASPDDLPWEVARKVHLDGLVRSRKSQAISCFESQIAGPDPVLAPHVLARLNRSFEVLLLQ